MKKILKSKKSNNILIYIVISIFVIYISLTLYNIDRNYLLIEKIFKEIYYASSKIIYKDDFNNKYSSNIINSKIKYLEKENNTLKEVLDIKSTNKDYVASKVINRQANSWYNYVIINKGYKDNINIKDPVFNDKGLVGFISKTSKNTSEVMLLTRKSNNLSVAIEKENNTLSGVLDSYDKKRNLFKVTSVISKEKIEKGSAVSLSGYNNDLYKGMYVGKVVKELNDNYGLSKSLFVKSDVDFNNIDYLIVETKDINND